MFLPIITTFVVSWIQRTWVFARFGKPKSSADIIFGLIIIKEKQTELKMPYLVFFSEMMKKKPTFELRTLESFIVCSSQWQTHQFQVSLPRFWASCPCNKSSSAEPTLCHSSSISGIPFELSLPMSNLMKPILVVWGSSCKCYRRPTAKPKNWSNQRPTDIKKAMKFFTIRAYHLYLKPFKQSWLAVTTTIFWPGILASKKLANYWPKSTTRQPSATTSRPT